MRGFDPRTSLLPNARMCGRVFRRGRRAPAESPTAFGKREGLEKRERWVAPLERTGAQPGHRRIRSAAERRSTRYSPSKSRRVRPAREARREQHRFCRRWPGTTKNEIERARRQSKRQRLATRSQRKEWAERAWIAANHCLRGADHRRETRARQYGNSLYDARMAERSGSDKAKTR